LNHHCLFNIDFKAVGAGIKAQGGSHKPRACYILLCPSLVSQARRLVFRHCGRL
jgi:hypothetical protein